MGLCESTIGGKNLIRNATSFENRLTKDEKSIVSISCVEVSQARVSTMQKHWETIMAQRPDICHRTMLKCIEASPKLNEIIACGRYCFRDLTKWPKLDRICTAQREFFRRLLMDNNLNPEYLVREAERLGSTHRQYAQYGLKPQFLDLFQQNFLSVLEKLNIEDETEKKEVMAGWSLLLRFIIDQIYRAYSLHATVTPSPNPSPTPSEHDPS